MDNMNRYIIGLVLGIMLGFGLGVHLTGWALNTDEPAVPESVCQEDEPCWDCETMGDRVCGPVSLRPIGDGGHIEVVDGEGRTIAVVSPENAG